LDRERLFFYCESSAMIQSNAKPERQGWSQK